MQKWTEGSFVACKDHVLSRDLTTFFILIFAPRLPVVTEHLGMDSSPINRRVTSRCCCLRAMFLPQASFYLLPHCCFMLLVSDLQRRRRLLTTLDHIGALNHVNSEISLAANPLPNGRFLGCVDSDGDDERKYFALLFHSARSKLRIPTCAGCNYNF